MKKVRHITETIRCYERGYAPGSETVLWGYYCDRIMALTGTLPYAADIPDTVTISDDEAQWWITAYERYDELEGYEDIQQYFDSI